MARSLNSVQLIGNLTRDPELRYTPQGTAVVSMSIATNRSWTTDTGEKKEETEFHRVIAWGKLAELCSQLLSKGSKAYVHGRLANRSWTGQDGAQKSVTEIVIDDMMVLTSKRESGVEGEVGKSVSAPVAKKQADDEQKPVVDQPVEDVSPDDIPF